MRDILVFIYLLPLTLLGNGIIFKHSSFLELDIKLPLKICKLTSNDILKPKAMNPGINMFVYKRHLGFLFFYTDL